MATLTLEPKYIEILQAFGSLQESLKEAVHGYAVERINQRIAELQGEIAAFEKKYGMSYQQFCVRINNDDEFVEELWETEPTWKIDLNAWEYYVEGLSQWHGQLENILIN